jgi:hypothetical protein
MCEVAEFPASRNPVLLSQNRHPPQLLNSVPETRAHLLPCRAMDYLWTPWRYAYVTGAERTTGCIFCDLAQPGDDEKRRIVYRAKQCFIVLNTYPYTPGHVMIVPYAHLDELQTLPQDAARELMDLSQKM